VISPPSISGVTRQGRTLRATKGRWANRPRRYQYQWQDCSVSGCTNIAGANARRYTLAPSDAGDSIDVVVKASNAVGSASATSAQTAVIPTNNSSLRQSVVFWLAWDGGELATLPWRDVTQVDLFSLATCVTVGDPAPDCTGPASLSTEFNGVTNVASFVNTVHQHGKLAMITIGGSTNPNWFYPCNPSDVGAFASNLVSYMHTNGFDGIDLDIEQDANTGTPEFTAAELLACSQSVYEDAKALTTAQGGPPLVTSDVDPTTDFDIGQIENPYVEQFNAMSYGVNGLKLESQINALETQSGIPDSKITAGIDIGDYPPPKSDCEGTASYAASSGLAGTMLWFGQADAPKYSCLNAIGPHLEVGR
jgi:GH18 family chitinase